MEYKYRFSLFTATYNRGELLLNLYKDIINQTFKGAYEWIVISDGSTDNTDIIMQSIIAEKKIPIKYVKKENGGKHTAWRMAMPLFEGQYIITCDDDDPIIENTLEIFDKHWSILERSSNYEEFWEIRSRGKYENGELVGEELPKPYFDSDYNEVTFKLKKGCEMGGCRKVEILKDIANVPNNFLYESECSNFPEGIRWSRAARKYKTRFIPDITRIYVVGHDSLCVTPKGQKRSRKKNFNSLVNALYDLNERRDLLLKYQPISYVKTVISLSYNTIRVKTNAIKHLNNYFDKIIAYIACIPVSLIYIFRK